jgi:predicted ATPase/DNA-binding SARP family transcriptional activator/DNA-binding CsgD family transcriptional regulator
VRIRLLGDFRVSIGTRTVGAQEWRLRKAADLVKLLALAQDHRMHREQAMDLLWPGSGPKAAANNLRQALHAARRVLDPTAGDAASSPYLRLEGDRLVLCPEDELWVDVEAFEAATVAARRSHDPAVHQAALNLYAGDLLLEDRYEDWTENRREALRRDRLTLLVEMAELSEKRGDLGSAIDALREAVSEEPAHEEAHADLMRLYAKSGQRYQALRQYEQIREALRRGFGTEPGAASRRLHEEIVSGRFPIPHRQSSDNVPFEEVSRPRQHNVPAALSRFVGREREKVEVERALTMTRLLTFTGVGGCGKTRLALEVTRDVAGAYRDGAWLVELASLSDPDLLPQAVAATLHVREQRNEPPIVTLQETLGAKEVLLVLDNCEHLLDACARLAVLLLGSCPGLRMLATSREALGVAGEANWVVSPLSVPETERPTTVEEIAASESVQLFLDRAKYRRPTFALSPHNVPAVAEICRRLEGIPLAVELAAARLGTMSVEEIAARLGNSLGLLTKGDRTATPRQRTLRATLGWSYEMLSEPERILFARLAVFAGGWTLVAAEAVVSGYGIEKGEVLDLLSSLVDKSLAVTEAAAGDVRHRMLEPVRQYAQERLAKSGQRSDARSRHAAYFVAEAEAAEPELFGSRQRAWLDRLEREHDNHRAALDWSIEQGDELGLRLGGALSRFWYIRGYLSEGRRWLEKGLVESGAVSAPARAKALAEAGWLAEAQDDYQRASAAHEASLSVYQRLGDEMGIARSLANLGRVAVSRGDEGRATKLLEETLAVLRTSKNERDLASVLTSLGMLALARGDHVRTATLFEEALYLRRKARNVRGVAVSLNNLGFATLFHGDGERAMVLFEEALAKNRAVGDKQGIVVSLINQGLAALAQANHRRATELLEESLTLLRELENKQTVAEWMEAMAAVAGAQGQTQRAARLWGAAQCLREDIGVPLPPDERAILEPHLASAHSLLETEAWVAALTEGRGMTSEQAVEYALSEEEHEPRVIPTPQRRPPVGAQPDVLTRREEEVAAMVAQGMPNRQIAQELFLSEHTVKRHISKILRKLGLASRAEVAAWTTERLPLTPPFE